ncbi:MAG: hypothetical protein LC754_16965 [Acidobacteria bacterium]|nr:hypothetical protein [Acidobacteriota bacterium]
MARFKPIDYERIIRSQYLVKLSRKPLDQFSLYGFVLSCSETLTLLHVLDKDTFTLNGYSVIRNEDVSLYAVYDRPDYYFDSRVLKLKGIKPEPKPEISIATLPELLNSINMNFPLIAIHREKISDEECFIGRLSGMTPKTFTLFEIDACGEWDRAHRYRFEDITKVNFGGGYEEALALIANEDAKKKKRRKRDAR